MNADNNNTPRTVCRAIIATAALAAAIATATLVGCSSPDGGGSRREDIAAVLQAAYDLGGRAAVSNRIDALVAEGKVTPAQAARLHALAQLAYEGLINDLTADAAPDNASNAAPNGECNEDANCGTCADCTADE